MTSIDQPRGIVRLYCAGGLGLNIGRQIAARATHDNPAFANVEVTFIDTSRSNVHADINKDDLYIIEGMDGSGKKRDENAQEISSRVRDILLQHKPADLSIVISSGGGGSGSVIGPSLVSELLERGLPVIPILIGSKDTRLEANNTLRTIKSYAAIAKLRDKPVSLVYVENSPEAKRSNVDSYVISSVTCLAGLYSRANRELDSQDLFNWLNYQRVTSFTPRLTTLSIANKHETSNVKGAIVSVATLAASEDDTRYRNLTPEYQCVGYMPSQGSATEGLPMHFVISDGDIVSVVQSLHKLLDDLEEQNKARAKQTSFLSSEDVATETGLIL